MREVRIIPAAREFSTEGTINQFAPKRRVAGYARVSTDRDGQLSSYEAQIDYYTTMNEQPRHKQRGIKPLNPNLFALHRFSHIHLDSLDSGYIFLLYPYLHPAFSDQIIHTGA